MFREISYGVQAVLQTILWEEKLFTLPRTKLTVRFFLLSAYKRFCACHCMKKKIFFEKNYESYLKEMLLEVFHGEKRAVYFVCGIRNYSCACGGIVLCVSRGIVFFRRN